VRPNVDFALTRFLRQIRDIAAIGREIRALRAEISLEKRFGFRIGAINGQHENGRWSFEKMVMQRQRAPVGRPRINMNLPAETGQLPWLAAPVRRGDPGLEVSALCRRIS